MWKIIVVVYLIGVVFFGSIDYREDCVRNLWKKYFSWNFVASNDSYSFNTCWIR